MALLGEEPWYDLDEWIEDYKLWLWCVHMRAIVSSWTTDGEENE